MQINEIAVEINKINIELNKLQKDFNMLNNKKDELIKEWRHLCSHPNEYLEVCNKFYHDDHGEIKKTNPKDYKYRCSACGKEDIE